jgi:hypothetical protein
MNRHEINGRLAKSKIACCEVCQAPLTRGADITLLLCPDCSSPVSPDASRCEHCDDELVINGVHLADRVKFRVRTCPVCSMAWIEGDSTKVPLDDVDRLQALLPALYEQFGAPKVARAQAGVGPDTYEVISMGHGPRNPDAPLPRRRLTESRRSRALEERCFPAEGDVQLPPEYHAPQGGLIPPYHPW